MANLVLKPACVLVGFWMVIAASEPARSQSRDSDPGDVKLAGSGPVAGYETVEAFGGGWQTVQIFAAPNLDVRLPDGRPWIEFTARRTSGERNDQGVTTWASSRDCPALRNTLVWLSTLIAPRIEIPGISPSEAAPEGRRPITVTADGLQTTVWGRGTQPDYTAYTRVEISSNGGLIAEFGRAANANLAPCWRNEEPRV